MPPTKRKMTDRENTSTRDTTPTGYHKSTPTSGCPHIRTIDSERQSNCLDCGIYIPRKRIDSSVYTYRENTNYSFYAEIPLGEALDEMKTIMGVNRTYDPKPNYIRYRRFLVDWMCEIGDTIRLTFTTIHHSVALMDTFFSRVEDIETTKEGKEFLQLVALTSIFISAKFCEKDSRGPTAANISFLTKGQYSEKQILSCERHILRIIDWKLHFATPADFLVLFLNQGIVYSNDEIYNSKRWKSRETESPSLKIVQYVRKYAEFFVDLWLQEYEFQKFESHTLAWAIVLASRRAVHFKKTWNPEFEFLLDCSQKDVEVCYREIYKFYMASFPNKVECKKEAKPKEESQTIRQRKSSNSSTSRTTNNALKNRSNSIKSHLWNIEKKDIVNNKPRTHIRKLGSNQKSGDRSSVIRQTITNSGVSTTLRETSLNCNITTPDKPLMNTSQYKSSSSNKKSSIKRYKPADIAHNRIPRPALMDLNSRRPKLQSRNSKMEYKRPTKLDFGSQSSTLKLNSSSRSRKTLASNTSTINHISDLPTGWSTSSNKDNILFNRNSMQALKPGLKLKLSKSKVYTTIDAKAGLNTSTSFMANKSRNPSCQKINDLAKNYRSMSNLRPADNKPNVSHNSSLSKYPTMGIGLNLGSGSHNKSYGRIYPDSTRQ